MKWDLNLLNFEFGQMNDAYELNGGKFIDGMAANDDGRTQDILFKAA